MRSSRSCTIITTSSNSFVATIHDRMPVVLPRDAESVWLDDTIEDPSQLRELLTPYPGDRMAAYSVSMLVNSPRNDLPECVAPVT